MHCYCLISLQASHAAVCSTRCRLGHVKTKGPCDADRRVRKAWSVLGVTWKGWVALCIALPLKTTLCL